MVRCKNCGHLKSLHTIVLRATKCNATVRDTSRWRTQWSCACNYFVPEERCLMCQDESDGKICSKACMAQLQKRIEYYRSIIQNYKEEVKNGKKKTSGKEKKDEGEERKVRA